ncbi:unnamed protein product [Closterium sp. NIES-53]
MLHIAQACFPYFESLLSAYMTNPTNRSKQYTVTTRLDYCSRHRSRRDPTSRLACVGRLGRRRVTVSAEGDCYLCVPSDQGIEAAALGAIESALPGTTPVEALHTFTLDSCASRCFFRDSTTLTPLPASVPVRLADPSGHPFLAHSSTVLPCPAVPCGSLSRLHLPSFSTNLVSTAALQDAMVTTTTPGGQRVSICTYIRTGRHLATFTRPPGSSLYTQTTEPPQVAASAQVSASGPVAAPCSCCLLSHQSLLWNHHLGHPSVPRLRGMHSRLLVSGLPWSVPPLPPSPAPPCLPCVEGRQRTAPHSSSFPPKTAPLQTLHMDVWGPARVRGQGRERYFLLVVDDYTHYTMVFPLRSKGEAPDALIPWIRTVHLQLRELFREDLLVLRLHSDKGGEFSSDLFRGFCRGEGILQSFTLPASLQQNGVADRRIGLVMEVALTSMIHAATPHFLWSFAVQYAAHQLNLWPRVSLPETSPTLRWTGKVGDGLVFRVWGSRALFRDTSADKLSSRAITCVFLGFPPDAPGWQFYHPTSRRVTVDSGVAGGAAARGAASGGAELAGAEPGGVELASVEPGGAEPKVLRVTRHDSLAGGSLSHRDSCASGLLGAHALGVALQELEDLPLETLELEVLELLVVEVLVLEVMELPELVVLEALELENLELEAVELEALELETLELEVLELEALELETLELEVLELEILELEALALEGLELEKLELETLELEALELEALELETLELEVLVLEALELEELELELEPLELEALELEALALRARGAGAGGVGAGGTGAGGTVQRRLFFVLPPPSSLLPPGSILHQVLSLPSSIGLTPPLLCPPPHQTQPQLQPDSSVLAPSSYTEQTYSLSERREPASHPASPVCVVRIGHRVPRPRPPLFPGTHIMALHPSSVPLRVPLPSPHASSLADGPDPESDLVRAASPTNTRLLGTIVTDPLFESAAASALVAELVDFSAASRLNYAASLEDFECLTIAVAHLVAILLTPEEDPDAPDIPTPRSYVEAITGPYSSQWQTAMDAEMALWKSTCMYVDAVPPSGANIVDGMWIFREKRPPGTPPAFKARYVARGFSQRQRVNFFQTFSPTPKMTTLRVLLHVAAQRDYELHFLDFSTAFLQGSLHEEIWLRRPPGFTGTTLAVLGFAPSTAGPSLFLRTDTSLLPFYVLVYIDNLVFATADIEALALVKSKLQKRHTCTDLGEQCSYLGLHITQDGAHCTITLTQSHMVHHVLQRFGFRYSSPQSTPLPTGHSLSASPSDESVELNGSYPELVGCLMYLMTCTRPDLAYPLSILTRYVAPGRHRPEHWEAAKRVLRYLCSTSGMGIVLGGQGPIVLTGHADASWVDDLAMQRSSQGYTLSLGSGSVSWWSTCSSSVLSSSCDAEIYARAMAAQETKHIALGYFLARELQQHGQLRLAYVVTRANAADIFTKALQLGDHQPWFAFLDWSCDHLFSPTLAMGRSGAASDGAAQSMPGMERNRAAPSTQGPCEARRHAELAATRGNDDVIAPMPLKPQRPPCFDPSQCGGSTVQSWVFIMNVFFDENYVESDAGKIRYAVSVLRVPAMDWWRFIVTSPCAYEPPSQEGESTGPAVTWSSFCKTAQYSTWDACGNWVELPRLRSPEYSTVHVNAITIERAVAAGADVYARQFRVTQPEPDELRKQLDYVLEKKFI